MCHWLAAYSITVAEHGVLTAFFSADMGSTPIASTKNHIFIKFSLLVVKDFLMHVKMTRSFFLLFNLVVGTICFGMKGIEQCKTIVQSRYGTNMHCSPQKFCRRCELKRFAGCYGACLFCRRPLKLFGLQLSRSCTACSVRIQDWLVKKLKISDDWRSRENLTQGAHQCLSNASYTVGRKYIADFIDYSEHESIFKKGAPYLYRGVIKKENGNTLHVWIDDIDIAEQDKRAIAGEDSEDYLRTICEKYNVFGVETGEVVLQKMPENVAAIYEEEVKE